MDWEAWARRAERAIDVGARGDWRSLFAPEATFSDPNTSATDDLRRISRETRTIFPDWRQQITWIRGTDEWAVFEWIGRATYVTPTPDAPGSGTPIEMKGATIVEVDERGLVTSWRDYLDRKEPEEQIKSAIRGRTRPVPAPEG